MHLIHLVYKRPCFLQKNTAVQVLRQGLKTNKQEQETNKQKQKKWGRRETCTQERRILAVFMLETLKSSKRI